MLKYLSSIIKKETFNPTLLGLLTNPFYLARKGLYKNIRLLSSNISGNVLDIGCGSKPYQQLFNTLTYVGLDVDFEGHSHDNENIDVFYDGKVFPFENNSYDSIVAFEVFEHVFNPDEFLSEINRVLISGGNLLLTVPFVWDEHEQPFDFSRYSSFGLKHLLEKHGFQVIVARKSTSNIGVIFQLLNAYVYKVLMKKKPKIIKLLSSIFLILPINILGSLFSILLPQNPDLYLDNIILAKKIDS